MTEHPSIPPSEQRAKDPPADVLEAASCPVCGSTKATPNLRAAMLENRGDLAFQIVKCTGCGLLYTSPRLNDHTLSELYTSSYYDGLSDDRGVTKVTGGASAKPRLRERLWRTAMRDHLGYPGPKSKWRWLTWFVAQRLRKGPRHLFILPWVGEGRLLDFGCGGCQLLRIHRARGWQVAGIDYSKEQMAKASEAHGLELAAGTWPGEPFADRQFDVITAWHVLEHLPDPVGWMEQAARQLAPGGLLVVATPDAASAGLRWFKEDWWGLDVPVHLSHFTRDQLGALAEKAGLTIEAVREQPFSSGMRKSAARRANRTQSRWWRWLKKRRFIWSVATRYATWRRQSDGVVIIARKTAPKKTDAPAS